MFRAVCILFLFTCVLIILFKCQTIRSSCLIFLPPSPKLIFCAQTPSYDLRQAPTYHLFHVSRRDTCGRRPLQTRAHRAVRPKTGERCNVMPSLMTTVFATGARIFRECESLECIAALGNHLFLLYPRQRQRRFKCWGATFRIRIQTC